MLGFIRIQSGTLVLLTLLTGCSSTISGYPRPSFDSKKLSNDLKEKYEFSTVIATYAKPGTDRRLYRDEVIAARLHLINANYYDFLRSSGFSRVASGVGLDWASIATSAAAAVATGGASQALAGASTGLQSANSSLQKQVYLGRARDVLRAGMDAARSKVLPRIYAGLLKKPDEYPLVIAWADLDQLELASTIESGSNELIGKAAEEVTDADARIDNLVKVELLTPEAITEILSIQGWAEKNIQSDAGKKKVLALAEILKITVKDGTSNREILQMIDSKLISEIQTSEARSKLLADCVGNQEIEEECRVK